MSALDPYSSDEYAALYDFAFGRGGGDVAMYEQFARRGETPSLELGVGSGRIALQLAAAGLDVVGIDTSRPMLDRITAEAAGDIAARIRLVEADMRDFDLGGERFDLVYCAGNTFQHMLTTDHQLRTLRCVARHLAAGGLYVMHVRTPNFIDWTAERTPLYLRWTREVPGTDDRIVRFDSTTISAAEQTATTTYIFDRVGADGAVHRRLVEYTLRYTGLSEMRLLMERAGLRVGAVYADPALSPYEDDSDTMVIVAELEGG